ncbi:MAG: FkbM family methyltransferase [Candidatus Doudnabacteria bacterium]|nr:FkbM family methyltransferase [Candidatus Doudnabacteria bacterium]
MHKIARLILGWLERALGKKIVYVPGTRHLQNKTAVKTEQGFWYVGDITDTHDLAYGILHNGVLEKNETELVKKILESWLGSGQRVNFYDIGANSGYYGILAAFLGKGKIRTYSFEPLREFCESLRETSRINSLDSLVSVNNFALGSKNGEAEITLAGTGSSLNPRFLGLNVNNKRKVVVKKLDDYINTQADLVPNFIKIDVEGFEFEVLIGAEETISKFKPVLYVEIARSLNNLGRNFINSDFEKTFSFFERFGYVPFVYERKELSRVDKNFNRQGVFMFLFVPESQLRAIQSIF